MTTAAHDADPDLWRVRFETASVDLADAEAARDHWQQCALDFAEILASLGHPVTAIEPLLNDVARLNAAAVNDAAIGQTLRESVQSLVTHAEQQRQTQPDTDVLDSLLHRLTNLAAVAGGRYKRSMQTANKTVQSRRDTIRDVLLRSRV